MNAIQADVTEEARRLQEMRRERMPEMSVKELGTAPIQAGMHTRIGTDELAARVEIGQLSPLHSSCAEQGQALVEFAVCLPILLLVVTGIFTFGLAINNYLILTNATDTGARQLAISRGQTTDPCATAASAVYAAAPLLTQSSLSFNFVLNGSTYSAASCNSSSTSTGAAGQLVQGSAAQVTVTYPCTLAVYGSAIASLCSLQAQTTERVQ